MQLAGVDVGNVTTEVVIASLERDGRLVPSWHGEALTAGPKGSESSLVGVAALLERGEGELGLRCEVVAIAALRGVETLAPALETGAAVPSPVRDLVVGSSGTPGGTGAGVGRHLPLDSVESFLASAPPELEWVRAGPVVLSVPAGSDFELAAQLVLRAVRSGICVAGVVVAADEGVLIANRIGLAVPVVDQADLNGLSVGEWIALEVRSPASESCRFDDPVALAVALQLDRTDDPRLSAFIAELADSPAVALVATSEAETASSVTRASEFECLLEGKRVRLPPTEAAALVLRSGPGVVRQVRLPEPSGGRELEVSDAFLLELGGIDDGAWLRRRTVHLRGWVFAFLARKTIDDAPMHLAKMTGRRVVTVCEEPAASHRGAASTPGFPRDSVVVDIGGGTIDAVHDGSAVTAAGGGVLVTVTIATALGLPFALAERVKAQPAVLIETPHLARGEDGRHHFLSPPAPPEALGHLCLLTSAGPVPFTAGLAPEEWRGLRLAVKRAVLGVNIRRCLQGLEAKASPLVLVGGGAKDAELMRVVSDLLGQAVVVGRGHTAGRWGPRYAVAWGLAETLADHFRPSGPG